MDKVSIKDVAQAAGVSTATVSYVLNDSRPVTQATRTRVLEAVHQLRYRPNVTGRSLQAQRTYLIGYCWRPLPPRQSSPILDRFIHSMGVAAYQAGYHLLAFPAPSDEDEVAVYHNLVMTNRVDGIVLSATNFDDPRVAYLETTTMPFVAFGRAGDHSDEYPWVDVDGRAGMRLAVEHLAEQGYKRIGMLAWPPGSQTGEHRYRGYRDGMRKVGLEARDEWVARVPHDPFAAYEGMTRLLALPEAERPDAVVCVSDQVALGAMNAILAAGLRVGPDIGVVGFDNMPLAEVLYPPLSSIHQPVDEIGQLIIRQLRTLIRSEALSAEERQVLMEPTLVVRESSRRDGGR
jgi:DNA-binding LacI/PurR family transcriptional regulator